MVTFNGKEVTRVALDAIFASRTSYSYEVVVVDNNSQDGVREMVEKEYPAVTLIKNPDNRGFGKGNNQGIKVAKGDYVLLLNTDTKVAPDTFQVMVDFMKARPDVGIGTCKLVKPNGELDWACRRSFPDPAVAFYRLSGLSKIFKGSKRLAAYNLTNKSIDEETEVDSCSGAFALISRACLDKIKGFDEDYFMYGEDLDLCYRAQQAGFKVWYYPKTTTIHFRGQSSRRVAKQSLWAFHDAMWIFYKKHLYRKYNPLFSALVYVGIWARYYQKSLFNAFRREKFVSR